MPFLRLHLVLAALLVSACDARRAEPPVPDGGSAGVAAVEDCPLDTTFRHDDPVALVEEFVRRDAEGAMEREDLAQAWQRGALLCAEGDRSGRVEIITTFRVVPGPRRADTAWLHLERSRAYTVDDTVAARPRLSSPPRRRGPTRS